MPPENIDGVIGEAMRRRRRQLKLRQKEVAEEIGVTQQTVARWEGGQRPDEEYVDKIAEFLELDTTILSCAYHPVLRAKIREDDGVDPLDVIRGIVEDPLLAQLDKQAEAKRTAAASGIPTDDLTSEELAELRGYAEAIRHRRESQR